MSSARQPWDFTAEERTSGIFAKAAPGPAPTPLSALAELRAITGDEPVAVHFFGSPGRAPEAVASPVRPRKLDAGYSLTHRLSSWLHSVGRGVVVEVPFFLAPWFPSRSVIVVSIATPDWEAGVLIVQRSAARHAAELRSLAADLALRVQEDERRARLETLRGPRRTA
jgi:hypothetical protein